MANFNTFGSKRGNFFVKYFFERHTLKAELDKLISANYRSKDFSVSKLAALMQLNERTLLRQCRKHLAVSPSQLIQTFKIEKAKKLVAKGLESKEISIRVGYSCKSAFLQAFKKEVGYSPTYFLLLEC